MMPRWEAIQAMTEIDIHGQLAEHPYTVKYHDSFIAGTKVNIVMEFCPNGDLQEMLRSKRCAKRSLPEAQVIKYLIQICLSMLAMHDKGILHRDLKTQNIFLTKNNDIRIGDFGLARQWPASKDPDSAATNVQKNHEFQIENTTKVGTPFYLAPEHLYRETKQPYTVKSDVWALGIILYELCSLRKPFNGTNEIELY